MSEAKGGCHRSQAIKGSEKRFSREQMTDARTYCESNSRETSPCEVQAKFDVDDCCTGGLDEAASHNIWATVTIVAQLSQPSLAVRCRWSVHFVAHLAGLPEVPRSTQQMMNDRQP